MSNNNIVSNMQLGHNKDIKTCNGKIAPVYGQNWSRTKYDVNQTAIDIRQETSKLQYMLDPIYAERCKQCRAEDSGYISKQGISYNSTKPLIDQESELFNMNRVLSRDPNYKYIPECKNCNSNKCKDGLPCGGGFLKDCDKCGPELYNFESCQNKHEYTRLSNPTALLKETGYNRFQPLCLNPQDITRLEHPGEININYRMVVKDNHRPYVPKPLDQTLALPKSSNNLQCYKTDKTCASYTAPLNNMRNMMEGNMFQSKVGI